MRFTIRDLVWLTVVVVVALSLGVGWWLDRWTLWGHAYENSLKAEVFESQLKELREHLETQPPSPLEPAAKLPSD